MSASDFELLQKIITEKALIKPSNSLYKSKNKIELIEPQSSDQNGYTIIIENVPENTLVVKTDLLPAPKGFFQQGLCKRADFVLLTQKNNKHWIVFIELKKGKGGHEKDIIAQLKGAECVIAYCCAIAKIFYQENNFLDNYQKCFVSIRYIGLNKKPSRHQKKIPHNTADKMLKITAPNCNRVYLKQLLTP